MHAPPRPDPGGNGCPGAPWPRQFSRMPHPGDALGFNCYPALPQAFSPCPAPIIFSSAPPRPKAKKGCPVHPWQSMCVTHVILVMQILQALQSIPATKHHQGRHDKRHPRCENGEAKISCGYKLPARYIISTVGPMGEHPKVKHYG